MTVEPLEICKQFGSRCKQWPRCPCGMNGVDPRRPKPGTAPPQQDLSSKGENE